MQFQEVVVKYDPEIDPFTERCNSDEGEGDKPLLVQWKSTLGHCGLLVHWEDVIQPTAKIPSECLRFQEEQNSGFGFLNHEETGLN
jgi:hypothetical protein